MPTKRQANLPFQRTITRRGRGRGLAANASYSNNGTPAPPSALTSAASTLTPTPRARSPATPLPEKAKILRSSWVFNHMPDEDRQTIYISEKTGFKE